VKTTACPGALSTNSWPCIREASFSAMARPRPNPGIAPASPIRADGKTRRWMPAFPSDANPGVANLSRRAHSPCVVRRKAAQFHVPWLVNLMALLAQCPNRCRNRSSSPSTTSGTLSSQAAWSRSPFASAFGESSRHQAFQHVAHANSVSSRVTWFAESRRNSSVTLSISRRFSAHNRVRQHFLLLFVLTRSRAADRPCRGCARGVRSRG